MNLREILDRVVATGAADRHRVPGFPTAGPVGFDLSGRSTEDMLITNVRTHHAAAVLVEHPEVGVANEPARWCPVPAACASAPRDERHHRAFRSLDRHR